MKTIYIEVPKELHAKFKVLCAKLKSSMTQEVRKFIEGKVRGKK